MDHWSNGLRNRRSQCRKGIQRSRLLGRHRHNLRQSCNQGTQKLLCTSLRRSSLVVIAVAVMVVVWYRTPLVVVVVVVVVVFEVLGMRRGFHR